MRLIRDYCAARLDGAPRLGSRYLIGCLGPIESVRVEAMQAVRHMMAEVDAGQGPLAEVLRIDHLYLQHFLFTRCQIADF